MTIPSNHQLAQLGGMIRYEFLMGWRRKTMLVLLFPLLLIAGLFVLTGGVQADGLRANMALGGSTPAEIEQTITLSLMGGTWIAFALVLIYLAPFGAADSIPNDRLFGVRELLDSLPLSSRVYLAGKLLGMWAGLLVALVFYGVITVIVCRIAIGSYDILAYLGMWLFIGATVGLVHSGLMLLLAAGQSTRRGAVIVGVAITIGTLLVVGDSFNLETRFLDYFNPSQALLTKYYLFNMASKVTIVSNSDFLLTIGAAFLELAVVAVGVWWWMHRQRDM